MVQKSTENNFAIMVQWQRKGAASLVVQAPRFRICDSFDAQK